MEMISMFRNAQISVSVQSSLLARGILGTYQGETVMYELPGRHRKHHTCTCVLRTLDQSRFVIGPLLLGAGVSVEPRRWLGNTLDYQYFWACVTCHFLLSVFNHFHFFISPAMVWHITAMLVWFCLMNPARFVYPANQTLRPWLHVRLKGGVTPVDITGKTPLWFNHPPRLDFFLMWTDIVVFV